MFLTVILRCAAPFFRRGSVFATKIGGALPLCAIEFHRNITQVFKQRKKGLKGR